MEIGVFIMGSFEPISGFQLQSLGGGGRLRLASLLVESSCEGTGLLPYRQHIHHNGIASGAMDTRFKGPVAIS